MPAVPYLLPRALPVLLLVLAGPMLLAYPLAYLPEALYAALPIPPVSLALWLSALLAGLGLALLAPGHRLATGTLVVLGLVGVYAGSFYGSLCSEEESRRVHAELAAMPLYNLAQPPAAGSLQALPESAIEPVQVSHSCLLPEDRLDGVGTIAIDLSARVLALIIGCLLPWRRPRRQAANGQTAVR